MIAIIGVPIARAEAIGGGVAGTAAIAAIGAARAGASVELVGKVGDDPLGDAVVLALGQQGVGHAALLRDAARPTPCLVWTTDGDESVHADESAGTTAIDPPDPARWPALEAEDVDLALRYLPDLRTIVVADTVSSAVIGVVTAARGYLGAQLVVAASSANAAPAADLVLAPPETDDDGAFAGVLGELAAALERGENAEAAFGGVAKRLGIEPSAG
jgi:hypothetical protein